MLHTSTSTTPSAPQDPTLEIPKDDQTLRITSPPPAYAPPPSILNLQRLTELSLARFQMQQAAAHNLNAASSNRLCLNRPLTTTVLTTETAHEADFETDEQLLGGGDTDSPMSPISLRINTSINVTKSNNVVCIGDAPPADHANAIAKAVVEAMQENSTARSGIPMIDEDGRPRPINIEVDASMLVEGSGNIVGSSVAVTEILRQQGLARRRRHLGDGDEEQEEEEEEQADGSPTKRRRCSK
ncbi:hypothetical protein LIA77_04497 [Sarocladium implicatum]|nr:hypothetical protein LIA77_04497 [Sarocladium implicatum]